MSREIFKLHGVVSAGGLEGVKGALMELDGKLKKVDKAFAQFGRQATKLGTTFTKYFTAPLVAVGAAVAMAENKTIQYAEQLVKLNDITGLSTDTLQEFKHVAAMTNVEFDAISGAVEKFARQLPEIAKKSGPAYGALKQLGVNVFDSAGRVRDINELLPEMIKQIQQVPDPMARLAIAQQVFGRGAGELGPILKMTGAQLETMRREAHDMGVVMSGESLKAAEAFGDQVDKLKEQTNAMVMKLASDFLPVLRDEVLPLIQTKVIPAMREFAEKIRGLIQWFAGLDGSIKAVIGITAAIGPLLLVMGKTVAITRELTAAFRLLRIAFFTNPFGIAILGAGALILAMERLNHLMNDAGLENAENGYRNKVSNLLAKDVKQLERLREIQKQGSWSYIDPEELKRLGVADGRLENIGKRIQNLEKLTAMTKKNLLGIPVTETPSIPETPAASNYNFDAGDKDKGLRIEEEYQDKLGEIQREADEWIDENNEARKEKARGLEEEIAGFMIDSRNMAAQKQKEANERIKMEDEQLATSLLTTFSTMGQLVVEGLDDGIAGMKKSFKGILTLWLDFIEKMVVGSIIANAAKKFSGFPGGLIGLAQAALEATALTALFEIAKKGIESFGSGAYVQGGRGGVLAEIGERSDSEVVLPMKAGAQALADSIITRLGSIAPALRVPAFAGAPAGRPVEHHWHIGVLVADDRGIKELERRQSQYRILEAQRRGAD